MKSQWSDRDASEYVERFAPASNEDVALRVYTSRLIGRDPTLVLHGGGNTSVKTSLPDDLGEPCEVLCVKGSGWDLAEIEPAGLPAVRLETLAALRALPALSDEAMVNAQRTRLLDAGAPNPSVETLLHAFLPHRFIDHSHADAILALVDQEEAEAIAAEVYEGRLGIVPFVMPGFELSKLAAEVYERDPSVEGLLLLRHGLFTFGATARESYERHVDAVDRAERFIARRSAGRWWSGPAVDAPDWERLAPLLRGRLGEGARRYVLHLRQSDAIRDYVNHPALESLSQRGVATPDHVIRTKRLPLLLSVGAADDEATLAAHLEERLAAYRAEYLAYVRRQTERRGSAVTTLDPDPRIVLVPGLGIVAAGATEKAARVAADVHEHTVDVIRGAEAVGSYAPLGEDDVFEMEYWSLEQAKLGKSRPAPLTGQVVYVSGAASGIGAATARAFAAQGAELYLVDRDAEALRTVAEALGAPHEALDVTDAAAVEASVRHAVRRFGGLDGAVSNAGVAPQGRMDECAAELLRASFEVNFFAHQTLAAAVTRVLRGQGSGGFLLFNASKAAFNPGPGFGPYAIPKAAVVALMKQYALENGDAGIRSNAINADRIRTGLLPAEMVRERASARGLDADAYFRSNLLGREVTAEDVAAAFVQLALSPATTGAVFTVDGGNIAAAPR